MADLIRIGKVSKINYEEGTVEVTYPDRDSSVTDALPVCTFNGMYNMRQDEGDRKDGRKQKTGQTKKKTKHTK